MAFLWFVCGLFVGILTSLLSQGIYWYKVPVVGKHGKLNETIEVSALWSISIILYRLLVVVSLRLGVYYIPFLYSVVNSTIC